LGHAVLAGLGIALACVASCRGATYAEWVASYGLSGDAAGMTADPDGDGMPNLMEYAFDGLSPVASNTSPTVIYVQYQLADNSWTALGGGQGAPPVGAKCYTVIRFKKRTAAVMLSYVPQASRDLNIWAWGSSAIEEWTDELGYTYARATGSADVERKAFMRVKVRTLD